MLNLLTEDIAAKMLGLQPKTLCRWRWEGRGPTYCKIGGAVRYRQRDLETFIAEGLVHNA